MTDDESFTVDIASKPTYTASIVLASGPIARVTVVGKAVRFGFYDVEERPVGAALTGDEASAIASVMRAAERVVHRAG